MQCVVIVGQSLYMQLVQSMSLENAYVVRKILSDSGAFENAVW